MKNATILRLLIASILLVIYQPWDMYDWLCFGWWCQGQTKYSWQTFPCSLNRVRPLMSFLSWNVLNYRTGLVMLYWFYIWGYFYKFCQERGNIVCVSPLWNWEYERYLLSSMTIFSVIYSSNLVIFKYYKDSPANQKLFFYLSFLHA